MPADNFRFWARNQFAEYRGCVAYMETKAVDGTVECGTCFHVGEGVFVTARHVVDQRTIIKIGFDDDAVNHELLQDQKHWGVKTHGSVNILGGLFFHSDPQVDVVCFRVSPYPKACLPLGGHFDNYLGQYELVLHRTLVLGYPPIPLTSEPRLVASVGEVNALVSLYVGSHPRFVISSMARGGFSGGPVLVAYDEENSAGGTAVLGMVTQSLIANDKVTEQGYMAVLTVEPIYECLEQHHMLPKNQGDR